MVNQESSFPEERKYVIRDKQKKDESDSEDMDD